MMSLVYNCHQGGRKGAITNLYEGLASSRHVFVGGEESLRSADGHVRPGTAGIVLQLKESVSDRIFYKDILFYIIRIVVQRYQNHTFLG